MFEETGICLGEKMTEQQVVALLQWINVPGKPFSTEPSNADILIAALGGNDLQRHAANGVIKALYDYDNGMTLREKFIRSEAVTFLVGANCEERTDVLGIAEYAKELGFSDASVAALLDCYTKCGLADERAAIEAMPNVGSPLAAQVWKPRDFDAITSASISDSTRNTLGRLTYKSGEKFYECDNIRQMAQFPNLTTVTVSNGTQNVTVDDLKHLFLEAGNLTAFTIKPYGRAQHVTVEMAAEALTQARAELQERGDGRKLDITILAG
jgi:hypothetical protein